MDYLVSHGLGGFVGRFSAPSELVCKRGDQVVVRTVRGLEAGEVLDAAKADSLNHARPGELLRLMTVADIVAAKERRDWAGRILELAQARVAAQSLPVMFLDAEALLDGSQAILQAVHWGECDISEMLEQLSAECGLLVSLHDLTAPAKTQEKSGCSSCGSDGGCSSKGGCSSGGCSTGGGCSSGSCSKGKVKSAEELTEYFSGLRKQMETRSARISLQ